MLLRVGDESGEIAFDVRPDGGWERLALGDPGEEHAEVTVRPRPFTEIVIDALDAGVELDPGEPVRADLAPLRANRVTARYEDSRLDLGEDILPGKQVDELIVSVGVGLRVELDGLPRVGDPPEGNLHGGDAELGRVLLAVVVGV